MIDAQNMYSFWCLIWSVEQNTADNIENCVDKVFSKIVYFDGVLDLNMKILFESLIFILNEQEGLQQNTAIIEFNLSKKKLISCCLNIWPMAETFFTHPKRTNAVRSHTFHYVGCRARVQAMRYHYVSFVSLLSANSDKIWEN